MVSTKPPSNIHNDYALDQLETTEDCRSLIALLDPSVKLGKITALPTSYSDAKQRERRPDKVVKAEVLDDDGKVIGERIYLFEFKSEIRKTKLLTQILSYIAILWDKHGLPITPVIVYTGKRRLRQNGQINFREHIRSKNPAVNEHDLDFPAFLLNLFSLNIAVLKEKAGSIAPGLYLAPRIFGITEEVVGEFFRLCAQLPQKKREQQLEKGCMFIVKYAPEFGWGRLVKIEQKLFPEEEWMVGRVKFSREAYGDEREEQGLELGMVKGRAEGLAEGLLKGKAEGLLKGKAEGLLKGKAEGKAEGLLKGKGEAHRDIAMRMLKEGEPEAKISRITGLSKKELTLLKRGMRSRKGSKT